MPPDASDKIPFEHVWNNAKTAIANLQRDTANLTLGAFETHVNSSTFSPSDPTDCRILHGCRASIPNGSMIGDRLRILRTVGGAGS